MNTFRVWIRPLGSNCRVRVDGVRNAEWLLGQLAPFLIRKTSSSINQEFDSLRCSFQITYDSKTSRCGLESVLDAIPQVELMADPA